jgi:uncharacterized membrane protein YccC
MKFGRFQIRVPDLANFKVLPSPPLPGISWSALSFAVRTASASLIALYIAFRINLDDPRWAAITVWVVAQSSRGMSLSKSQYRILGTALGAVAAIVLIALFSQTPELFLLALAAWIGLCTGVATSLRNFRAYAAVLAGYTAAIIGLDAAAVPPHAFDIALARFLNVAVGILVEAMLTAIFAPGAPMREVRGHFHEYMSRATQFCVRALRDEPERVAIQKLFAGALELDTVAEYAAAASAEVQRATGHLRAAIVALLRQLAAAQTLREPLTQCPELRVGLIDEAAELLERNAPDHPAAISRISSLMWRVKQALALEATASRGPATSRLVVLERLALLLTARKEVVARTVRLDQVNPPQSHVKFAFHSDRVLAWQNGIRAFAAVIAASVFWIYSAWPSGAAFVTTVGVVCALFSTRANSTSGAIGWLKGAACAAFAGILCNFALLPAVSDFGALACIAGLFMIGAGLMMRNPRTASMGGGFALFFWNFISPSNTARIGDAAFLNSALATLLGIAWATVAFCIVFPADRAPSSVRLQRAVRRDLAEMAGNPQKWRRDAWLSRTADRLGREFAPSTTLSSDMESDARKLLAAWTIGDSLITLQNSALWRPTMRRSVIVVRGRLRDLEFERLATACDAAARRILRQATGADENPKRELLDSALLLQTIADSARRYVSASSERANEA